jgi:hypothetical protein
MDDSAIVAMESRRHQIRPRHRQKNLQALAPRLERPVNAVGDDGRAKSSCR